MSIASWVLLDKFYKVISFNPFVIFYSISYHKIPRNDWCHLIASDNCLQPRFSLQAQLWLDTWTSGGNVGWWLMTQWLPAFLSFVRSLCRRAWHELGSYTCTHWLEGSDGGREGKLEVTRCCHQLWSWWLEGGGGGYTGWCGLETSTDITTSWWRELGECHTGCWGLETSTGITRSPHCRGCDGGGRWSLMWCVLCSGNCLRN